MPKIFLKKIYSGEKPHDMKYVEKLFLNVIIYKVIEEYIREKTLIIIKYIYIYNKLVLFSIVEELTTIINF